jgi:glycosyltransferase involved in cell wall biosynthesis
MAKLIYIYNSRMPIAHAHGFQVMQMCEAFVNNGCEVEVVAPMRVNPIKEDPFTYYKINKTFTVERLPCLDLIFLNNQNLFFWIQTITFLLASWFYLRVKKYDILYTREQMVGLFFRNFVLEIHSLPKNINSFHKKIWHKARSLVVLTPFIKEKLISSGVPSDKILVAPDGVKIEKFDVDFTQTEAREKLNLPKNKKLIGYVGAFRTLGMEKGLDIAIKAMKLISGDGVLVLVGGHSADIIHYTKLVEELGLKNRVIFIGRIDYDLVPVYLKAFDILTAPFPETEHYNFYMSPMKIFEYMASKRPIVSTNLPSLRDIIGGGEALLVSPGSVEEQRVGIERVLNDSVFVGQMVSLAWDKAKELTWDKRANRILKFI